jgi:flagellar motor switch protein FliN
MAGESPTTGQNELDNRAKQAAAAAVSSGAPGAGAPSAGQSATMKPGEIDELLNQAEQALASIDTPVAGSLPEGVKPFKLPDFTSGKSTSDTATLDLIRDVELDLRIELGRTHMHLDELLKLSKGSVVTLDKLAGDPVDIYVNGRLIARGEVLILNENFCVRVAELMAPENTSAPA